MAVSMETATAARTLTLGVCELLPLCELVFRVCVTHRFGLNSMALPRLGMWSVLRKWSTQTHFKHAHAFFHQRSSDDKTFPRPSPHEFFFFFRPPLCVDGCGCRAGLSPCTRSVCRVFMHSVFGLRPLVNVPLATNTLTCDLWK